MGRTLHTQDGSHSLYNLVSEVTSYHFYNIPLTSSKSLGPGTHSGRGLYKDVNTRRWGSLAAILETTTVCPQAPMIYVPSTCKIHLPLPKVCKSLISLEHCLKVQNLI